MKILLDEHIPTKVKLDFGGDFEVNTLKDMKWLGKKNGELLGLMTLNKFDFFITLDKNLKHQQNIAKFDIMLILIYAPNNKHQTLQPYIEKVKALLLSKQYEKFNEIRL